MECVLQAIGLPVWKTSLSECCTLVYSTLLMLCSDDVCAKSEGITAWCFGGALLLLYLRILKSPNSRWITRSLGKDGSLTSLHRASSVLRSGFLSVLPLAFSNNVGAENVLNRLYQRWKKGIRKQMSSPDGIRHAAMPSLLASRKRIEFASLPAFWQVQLISKLVPAKTLLQWSPSKAAWLLTLMPIWSQPFLCRTCSLRFPSRAGRAWCTPCH